MARAYLGPYYRHAEDLDSHLDALKAAGIPEWPHGFEGRAEDRVIGSALEALTSGRTWTGYVPAGPGEKTPFIQQFDLDNRVVFKGARSLLTGTVALSNDQICIRFDGYLWGRPLCGSVYRNAPAGKRRRWLRPRHAGPIAILFPEQIRNRHSPPRHRCGLVGQWVKWVNWSCTLGHRSSALARLNGRS